MYIVEFLFRSRRRKSREASDRNFPAAFGPSRQAGRGEETAVRGDGPQEEGEGGDGEEERRRRFEEEVNKTNTSGKNQNCRRRLTLKPS